MDYGNIAERRIWHNACTIQHEAAKACPMNVFRPNRSIPEVIKNTPYGKTLFWLTSGQNQPILSAFNTKNPFIIECSLSFTHAAIHNRRAEFKLSPSNEYAIISSFYKWIKNELFISLKCWKERSVEIELTVLTPIYWETHLVRINL